MFGLFMSKRHAVKKNKINIPFFEPLENRQLLSAGYASTDLPGTWYVAGQTYSGAIRINTTPDISAAQIRKDGVTDPYKLTSGASASDKWSVDITTDGTVTMSIADSSGGTSLTGQINSGKDVISLNTSDSKNQTLLIKHTTDNFTAADLVGTWNVATANQRGTIVVNKNGDIISAAFTDFTGQKINYIKSGTTDTVGSHIFIDNDGNIGFVLRAGTGLLSVQYLFSGAMSDSKDLIAVNLNGTATGEDLLVLTKADGTYAKQDLVRDAAAPWLLTGPGTSGNLRIDAKGLVTGTMTGANGTFTVNGGSSISGKGVVILTLTLEQNGTRSKTFKYSGVLNAAKNAFTLTPASGPQADFFVLTSKANHAPILTNANVKGGEVIDTFSKTFTYADLRNLTGAKDLDGDALSFAVTPLANGGTLMINGKDYNAATNNTIHAGDTLTWTPPAKLGAIKAFTLNANDGTLSSAAATTVSLTNVAKPVISVTAGKPTATEPTATIAAKEGVFTFTRTGTTAEALDVTYVLSGAATPGVDYDDAPLTGIIHFDAGQKTATLTITPLNDGVAEPDELITLMLVTPADTAHYIINNNIKKTQADVTVKAHGSPITLKASATKVIERKTVLLTITRKSSGDETLQLNITGIDDRYALHADTATGNIIPIVSNTAAVNFTGTEKTKKIYLEILDDNIIQPTANALVTLAITPNIASYVDAKFSKAAIQVTDNESTIAIKTTKNANQTTLSPGQITLTRTGVDLAVSTTIQLQIDTSLANAAQIDTDYILALSAAPQTPLTVSGGVLTLTMEPNVKTLTLLVRPINQSLASSKTITLQLLSTGLGYQTASGLETAIITLIPSV